MNTDSLKILFIDFFDSFSHNIVQVIGNLGHDIDVESYLEVTLNPDLFFQYDLIILGPGPGHVDDYFDFCECLRKVYPAHLFLGICLGHQILGVMNGYNLIRLNEPIHGVSSSLPLTYAYMDISSSQTKAMFYNSWSLLKTSSSVGHCVHENNQITLIDVSNGLGLQFHPESVGTTCPHHILDYALKLVYNKSNEDANEDYWSLRPKNHSTTQRTKDL